MTFRVGQEVQCIRSMSPQVHELFSAYGGDPQVFGDIYAIEAVRSDDVFPDKPAILILKGMKTAMLRGIELGWEPDDFRPVTSIKVFNEMLNPAPKQRVKA